MSFSRKFWLDLYFEDERVQAARNCKSMLNDYFEGIQDIPSLRERYKKLVFRYHPDLNPEKDDSIMKLVNCEYERLLEIFRAKDSHFQSFSEEKKADEARFDKELREKLDTLFCFPDEIVIEICGSWIWLSGETRKHKEVIKEKGFFFSGDKKKWYWKPSDYKRKNWKKWDIEKIRAVYGSEEYRKKYQEKEKEKEGVYLK